MAASTAGPFACDWFGCDFRCTIRDTLNAHMRLHAGDTPPFICDDCDAAFSSPFKLAAHTHAHADDPPFVCVSSGRCS